MPAPETPTLGRYRFDPDVPGTMIGTSLELAGVPVGSELDVVAVVPAVEDGAGSTVEDHAVIEVGIPTIDPTDPTRVVRVGRRYAVGLAGHANSVDGAPVPFTAIFKEI